MSQVFNADIEMKLEQGATTIDLLHTRMNPEFFKPLMVTHESIINGKRTYSKDIRFSEFTIFIFLWEYDDPTAKAIELLGIQGGKYIFSPFDMLWSKNVLILSVEIKPLEGTLINDNMDIARISMISADAATLGAYYVDRAGNIYTRPDGTKYRKNIRGVS